MLIRKLGDCPEITAADNTRLRELLHPDRDYPFAGCYSLAWVVLPVGATSLRHRLKTDEVYFIVAGRGLMHIDEDTAAVEPGDAVDIPPGSLQWIENTGEETLAFLCIVDPAWRAEDEEILS